MCHQLLCLVCFEKGKRDCSEIARERKKEKERERKKKKEESQKPKLRTFVNKIFKFALRKAP